jgi:hypothetical protein
LHFVNFSTKNLLFKKKISLNKKENLQNIFVSIEFIYINKNDFKPIGLEKLKGRVAINHFKSLFAQKNFISKKKK